MKKRKNLAFIAFGAALTLGLGTAMSLSANQVKEVRADDLTGSGTLEDPYQLGTKEELEKFRDIVNGINGEDRNFNACAVLTADIDLEGDNSHQWVPIGPDERLTPSNTYYYKGTFDGQGHTVSGLYFDYTADVFQKHYSGFFGRVQNATIQNMTIDGYVRGTRDIGGLIGGGTGTVINCRNKADVSGDSTVGGIAGSFGGTIERCYNTGTISTTRSTGNTNESVGGILGGFNGEAYSDLTNCYNAGAINGYAVVGGIIANANSNRSISIANCHNQGSISKVYASDYRGGIVCEYDSTDVDELITGNYYLTGTAPYGAKEGNLAGTISTSDSDMKVQGTFAGWDFENVWEMGKHYPILRDNPDASEEIVEIPGTGKSWDPYQLSTAAQFNRFRDIVNGINDETQNVSACAVLKEDIYLNGGDSNQWVPIGTDNAENRYNGTFDGQGHSIKGLYISDSTSTASNKGLFASCGAQSVLRNFSVDGIVYLPEGVMNIAGIVGKTYGTIENCTNYANVVGRSYVAGVVGHVENGGDISKCANYGDIHAYITAGGIIGVAYSEDENKVIISDCYNLGNITATDHAAGGIAGGFGPDSLVELSNCFNYETTDGGHIVSGNTQRGAIVAGETPSGEITFTSSYFYTADSDLNGSGAHPSVATAGLNKISQEDFRNVNTFVDWDFNNIWGMDADYPVYRSQHDMWIGIESVSEGRTSGIGWSFDLISNTLTLENFAYSGEAYAGIPSKGSSYRSCLTYIGEEDLNLVLVGTNSITLEFDNPDYCPTGLYAEGKIKVSGTGSLDVELSGTLTGYNDSQAIYSIKGFVLNSGTVIANSETTGGYDSTGLRNAGGLVELNGGSLTATGSKYGIVSYDGITIAEDVEGFVANASAIEGNFNRAIWSNENLVTEAGLTAWTDGAGTQGRTSLEADTYVDINNTLGSYKKIELATAIAIDLVIADKAISYNDAAPEYTYVAKIDDVVVTDATLLAEIAKHVTLTSAYTKGSNVGSYSIDNTNAHAADVFSVGDDEYVLVNHSGALTVSKINPVVTAPVGIGGLHYTGEDQVLIGEGTTSGGTILYSLDGINYSEEPPHMTNAGEYTVYYKVVGGTNYNDVEPATITATIEVNDKTELITLIGIVGEYYNNIKDDYASVAEALKDAIEDANLIKTNDNKTVEEIAAAVTALESALEEARIAVVEELIRKIGTVEYTEESLAKIEAAATEFAMLSDEAKEKVSNRSVLDDAGVRYVELAIADIGEVALTEASKAKLDKANELFSALPAELKAKVENAGTLSAAKAGYVVLLINDIGAVEYTDASKAKLDAASEAFNALTAEEQALVSNKGALDNALTAYAKLKEDHEKADAVIALIDAIGEVEYTQECKDKIDAARTAYDALSEDQKALVGEEKLGTLVAAETLYAQLAALANRGLPGWAVALIVIGVLLAALCGAWALLLFVFNKWIKVEGNAVRVFPFALGKKDGKQRLFAFPFKFEYREDSEIFASKEEALK